MSTYMNEIKIRNAICDVGQKLYDKEFVAANDGNISVKLDDNTLLVTPTAVSKGGMKPDEIVKMTLDGEILSGGKPSSEVKMHIQVYKTNPEIQAVVHAHPPISTAFAVARVPMETPILAEAVVNLGVVPVADFALPGTKEVPESIKPYVRDYNAVLLANHGLLTWGRDLREAFFRMESVEHYGKILLYVKQIGDPREFNCTEIDALLDIRKKIGVSSGGVPACKPAYATETVKPETEDDVKDYNEVELAQAITNEVMRQLHRR
ncbi:class II aldolase/adducin family protein [Vallitaleaceae bacterium 9-2]